ncbi:MAG: tRNA threonylcarbamoyladenosine dehydratase [bacterium]
MTDAPFSRTERLLGSEAVATLKTSHVAVFGIGGVGSFTAEALARCGIGNLTLIDADFVCASNINRQLIALYSTIGKPKAEVMSARIRDINPDAQVTVYNLFYNAETASVIDLASFDYIADAIDTVDAKVELIVRAKQAGTPIMSCMGAGNKLDPTRFEIGDIHKTSVCPLCKVMRKRLAERHIDTLKVVYSKENPQPSSTADIIPDTDTQLPKRRKVPGSIAFVPSVAGLILAGEIVKDLLKA